MFNNQYYVLKTTSTFEFISFIHPYDLSACGAFYTKSGLCYLVDTDADNFYKNATLLTASDINYFVRI